MSDEHGLQVVLCWHMHQPEYRDLRSGEYQLPWTYLHAIKDYVDMAAHIEAVPGARAVINLAPVLLEQLRDYETQLAGWLQRGEPLRDAMLAALVETTPSTEPAERLRLIGHCLRANEDRLIKRFAPYRQLAEMARWILQHPETLIYVDEQFMTDLVVWHHLAWLGETVRRSPAPEDAVARRLVEKARGFSAADRRELLTLIHRLVASVIPRYRTLAEAGKVELATSPLMHPILPLLLDFDSAREAMPDVNLPAVEHYPGGEARARAHIEQGLVVFEQYFGFRPTGCWPSEGSIDDATLRLLQEYGFQWAASGEAVLHNSMQKNSTVLKRERHAAFTPDDLDIACFFRDDGLSDMIGFTYSSWHADDAVANLVHHLENIAQQENTHPDSLVAIILDGENAWEHYPENGFYFLRAVYEQLATHETLRLTTFSDYLARRPERVRLEHIVAGSWVYGTLSTWIGDADKNRGWEMLCEAKECYDRVMASGRLDAAQRQRAERQLAVCEGSDWFWWFGDYNPAETVSDFEWLFRRHLSNLYQLLGEEAPGYLSHVFARGTGAPTGGGVMRRGQA